jgi:hypothetical protein
MRIYMGAFLLAACASPPDPKLAIGSTEYGFHNAGLVVGRTLAGVREPWEDPKGLVVRFRNTASGVHYETGTGMSGYTTSDYLAIWLPPGSYTVASVFAYNGAVGPADEPFRFVVKPGHMIYVGTLLNSWDAPRGALETLGRPLAVKRYGRLNCPFARSCDAEAEGLPPNTYVQGPPYAFVGVFDEGDAFLQRLRQRIPNLPDVPLQRWFMW